MITLIMFKNFLIFEKNQNDKDLQKTLLKKINFRLIKILVVQPQKFGLDPSQLV